ncbi:MAG: CHAT domain-containing protein [Cyclobacteriaceae bacterium]|nr:CHAT domain-containing protein [Cyclobacteriaceae bacterium]
MRFLIVLIIFGSVILPTLAQELKVRTRQVDYTQYDQALTSIGYAADKLKAAQRLLDISNSLFTPVDEEYFNARKMSAIYFEMAFDHARAIELTEQAIDAYEKNYPFYTRGYQTVTNEYALYSYLDLSRYLRALNLFEKAIKYLENKRPLLETNPSNYVRQQFYSEYSQALLGAERYEEAIAVALKLKELTESGALALSGPSPDEIYKINPKDLPEVQEYMKKAKEDYIKAMKKSQESLLGGQRITYNMVLGNAYYQQFKFTESIPYLKATADQMKAMMESSRKIMSESKAQMATYQLPDSVRALMDQSAIYLDRISEIGGSSTLIVIAATKANQIALAKQYADGYISRAVLNQLNSKFTESEKEYKAAFDAMKSMANYKFAGSASQMRKGFLSFYLNMEIQSGKLTEAYDESKTTLLEEEAQLKKNFQYFTESEKKEFFKAYNQKLERFYSLLLLMTEKNDNRSAELLDKILQTKGIILDVTREQEKLLKKIKDKPTLEQIAMIRKLRDKVAAFYQLSLKSSNPAMADSINRISIRINDLERKVNEKLGTVTDILKPVSWKQIQSKLKSDGIYLEILRLKRDDFAFDKPVTQYWGFVVKPGAASPVLFKISDGEAFEGKSLKNYQNRIRNQLEDVESYKTYWASLSEKLEGSTKIILSGDGVYHMINPLTLKNPQSDKYLLNEISLARVSTGRDVLSIVPLTAANQQIALIGNPEFAMSRKGLTNKYQGNEFVAVENDGVVVRSGLSELPGTQKEVESIQSMASDKGIKSNVLSGAQATEAGVKNLKNQQILHLATHGEFDQFSRADSYLKAKLILAGAGDDQPFTMTDYSKYEDGFLTAYEVTQLELSQTNLVVLSACETGTGDIQSGEGVWGLQRAFQLAGAKTVMGSLWKISDEATVTFMQEFYARYFSGAGINASYKAAMEVTMKEYPHPYFWGAFTLTGVN